MPSFSIMVLQRSRVPVSKQSETLVTMVPRRFCLNLMLVKFSFNQKVYVLDFV